MEHISALADQSIRRACGFAALGIGTTMLALSFDLALAFRTGAVMTGMLCLGLAAAGWSAPYRDMRRTELCTMLGGTAAETVRRIPRARFQALLASVLQDRLLWHADRVALAALTLWLLSLVLLLLR